jgi:hypothetical protein
MTASLEQLQDREDEERKMDKKEADRQAIQQVDRTIEMFNDINALFGYTRN